MEGGREGKDKLWQTAKLGQFAFITLESHHHISSFFIGAGDDPWFLCIALAMCPGTLWTALAWSSGIKGAHAHLCVCMCVRVRHYAQLQVSFQEI